MPVHHIAAVEAALDPCALDIISTDGALALARTRTHVSAPAHAHTLDPVKNNPSRPRGYFREQYLRTARNGVWGEFHDTACGGRSLVKIDEQGTHVYPVLCGQWACLLCGPMKAAWMNREVGIAVVKHNLTSFWTLTLSTERCAVEESHALITHCYDKLGMRLRRRYGKYSYFRVVEHTKAGMAHLHLLSSLHPPQQFVRDTWEDITDGSWSCTVEPVELGNAATYLTKYCSQQAMQRLEKGFESLKGSHFFATSRDIKLGPFRGPGSRSEALNYDTGEVISSSDYQVVDTPYWVLIRKLQREGFEPAVQRSAGVPSATMVRRSCT